MLEYSTSFLFVLNNIFIFLLELQKAIALFEEQRVHEQIQIDNFERYKQLREKRREEKGLS